MKVPIARSIYLYEKSLQLQVLIPCNKMYGIVLIHILLYEFMNI